MTDIFGDALDALFTSPLAKDAIYRSEREGWRAQSVRVIPTRGHEVADIAQLEVEVPVRLYDARVSELPEPDEGGRLEVGGEVLRIKRAPWHPEDDPDELLWRFDCSAERV